MAERRPASVVVLHHDVQRRDRVSASRASVEFNPDRENGYRGGTEHLLNETSTVRGKGDGCSVRAPNGIGDGRHGGRGERWKEVIPGQGHGLQVDEGDLA